jgi:hypothetical protein
MSKITLTPNAAGTGTFTLASPNSDTNRTFTLPDSTGDLLTSESTLSSDKLTGALPAIDGSSLTSLTSANLTGALPAIDGSSLTGIETSSGGSASMSLSGNAVSTITGIPALATQIQVCLYNQSWSAVSVGTLIQIGTSAGIQSTGYTSHCKQILVNIVSNRNATTGFNFKSLAAAERLNGIMTLTRMGVGSNTWVGSWMFGYYAGSGATFGGGEVTLSGELDRVSLKPESSGGTNDGTGSLMTVKWSL